MQRTIVGFSRDAESHWVAELCCGHRQHVRHVPPLRERTWVLSEAGRAAHMGSPLDCVGCDRDELPADFEPYKRTPEFSDASVPEGLRRTHSTRRGVWGLIHVIAGRLDYHRHDRPDGPQRLTPDAPGVVPPEVQHHVSTPESVRFFVEFWRAPGSQAAGAGRERASKASTDT